MRKCSESHENHECCGSGKCCDSACQCGGGCCCEGKHFQRRYQTKAEQIAELEAYLSELNLEVQAVEEMLVDLRK
jgi:hypothetical protein